MKRSHRGWSLALVGGAAMLLVAASSDFRTVDWPIYVVFLLLINGTMPFVVEVLPHFGLCLPELAATLGFLYIGGPPIAVIFFLNGMVITPPLKRRIHAEEETAGPMSRFADWRNRATLDYITESSTFAIGLVVRWFVASSIAGTDLPITNAWAILAAEASGYLTWALLSVLPFYPSRGQSRTLLPLSIPREVFRTALVDMALLTACTLTPFVFLISYGFQSAGLLGAALGTLAALAPHFISKRLIHRRRVVEEQNDTLEALNRELQQRERLSAIGKTSTIISHQILQHLGVIGLHADLIHHANDENDIAALRKGVRQNASAIEQSLEDVNRVLQDLLIFSRDQRVNLYEHPIVPVLEECIVECENEATSKEVFVEHRVRYDGAANFDKLKIRQATVNLLRNAIQVSPRRSRVILTAHVEGKELRISVTDQGPGILASEREKIFAPFHTTKQEGTGLGLTISRIFAEAHGGTVVIRDPLPGEGTGATFELRLPGAALSTTDTQAVAALRRPE